MKKVLSILFITFLFLSCNSPQNFNLTVSFEPDTVSVIKNPYMGWTLYSDGYQEVHFADKYWEEQDEASSYAQLFYLRWRWSDLEPEEGKYAWIYDENFKQIVQGALDRGLRLAFRVYVNGQDNLRPGTPDYVLEHAHTYTVSPGHQTPYADDEYFLEKYIKFIQAFGEAFNDPSKVDYVDSYGLGWWGEEAHMKYMDERNKHSSHKRIVEAYEQSFNKVINVVNQGHRDDEQNRLVYDTLGFSPRRDGYASMWFTPEEKEKFLSHFPQNPLVAEACYWQDVPVSSYESGRWSTWQDYYKDVVNQAIQTHANYLDLRNPLQTSRYMTDNMDDVLRFARHGGYRIYPKEIIFQLDDKALSIVHSWLNIGSGILPNDNPHLYSKYKVMFALFDQKHNLIKKIASNGIEVSDLVYERELSACDVMDLKDIPSGTYILATGVINSLENDSPDISLAVLEPLKISGEWIQITEFDL